MSSDPTTEDLIREAKKTAETAPPSRLYHYVHALCDRLEEEREKVPKPTYRCSGCGCYTWNSRAWATSNPCPECGRKGYWCGSFPWPSTDSPEPSDPEPKKRCTFTREHVAMERRCFLSAGHEGCHLIRSPWGTLAYPLNPDADTNDVPERAESVEPEPEDDPWEDVERIAAIPSYGIAYHHARALLDLRKREEETRRWHLALVGVVSRIEGRTDALGGHADRGNEAEAELRGRVGNVERWQQAMLDREGRMMDLLNRLSDRVEKLEAGRG